METGGWQEGEGVPLRSCLSPRPRELAQTCPESSDDTQAAERHGRAYYPQTPEWGPPGSWLKDVETEMGWGLQALGDLPQASCVPCFWGAAEVGPSLTSMASTPMARAPAR